MFSTVITGALRTIPKQTNKKQKNKQNFFTFSFINTVVSHYKAKKIKTAKQKKAIMFEYLLYIYYEDNNALKIVQF